MVDEWRPLPLADVVTLQRGFDLPAQDRQNGPVPILGSFGVTGWHDAIACHGEGVTIGRSGASIGVATYTEIDYWSLNTALFVRDFRGNVPRFVYYLLKSIDFTAYNSGSAQPSLNRNHVAHLPVVLPPLAEQRAIAEVLGALDDKIESNRSVIRTAPALAAAMLQEAGRGADRVRLGDVAEVRKGLSYKGAGLAAAGMPMVNLANAATFGGFKRNGWKYYTGEYKPRHIAQSGDLLVANTEQTWRNEILGWPMLLPDDVPEALFSHHVSFIDFAPEWTHLRLPVWAHLFTRSTRRRVEGMAHGTTVAALPAEALTGLDVPVIDAGASVLSDAEALLQRAWVAERESDVLARLRDTLLPALMSGELRVREAQALVPAGTAK